MRPSNMGGGRRPLKTSDLNVKILDRELNELRCRREMLQQEQVLLSLESETRQYAETNFNVPNMYENLWQPPPNRVNGPRQVKPWKATTQDYTLNMSQPMSSNYIPSLLDSTVEMPCPPIMSSIANLIARDNVAGRNQPALRARKNFGVSSQSNKVMQKRPQDPPNNLNSYPVKKRNDLVSKALDKSITAVKLAPKVVKKPDALCVLREDQTLSHRVAGRLETALGNLVKDIKLANSDNVEFQQLITKPTHRRIMKQEIRDRIRIVMLNQAVGPLPDIVKKYREKFPKETDKDIVDLVMNHAHHKSDSMVETEDPKEFFNKKFGSILEKKLKEMSSNLLKMYVSRQSTNATSDATVKLEESVGKESETNFVEAMKTLRSVTGKYVVVEERDVLYKYYSELIENILEVKLLEYLPNCKEQFLEIFHLDKRMAHIENLANNATEATIEENLNQTGDTVANDNDIVGEETLVKDEVTEESDSEINPLKINDTQTEVVSTNISVKETVSDAEEHIAIESDNAEDDRPVSVGPIKASSKAETPEQNETQLSPPKSEPKTTLSSDMSVEGCEEEIAGTSQDNMEEKDLEEFNSIEYDGNEPEHKEDSRNTVAKVKPYSSMQEKKAVLKKPEVRQVLSRISVRAKNRFKALIVMDIPWEKAIIMCQKKSSKFKLNANPENRARQGPLHISKSFLKSCRCSEVCIQNVNHMTKEKARFLLQCLISMIKQMPKGDGPRFEDCNYKSGTLTVCCRDKLSEQWLLFNVPHMQPWPGAKLTASVVRLRSKPLIVNAVLPSSEICDVGHAFSLLKAQNRGLNTEEWVLVATEEVSGGLLVTLSIDRRSAVALRESLFQACLGFKTVYFNGG